MVRVGEALLEYAFHMLVVQRVENAPAFPAVAHQMSGLEQAQLVAHGALFHAARPIAGCGPGTPAGLGITAALKARPYNIVIAIIVWSYPIFSYFCPIFIRANNSFILVVNLGTVAWRCWPR